MTLNHRPWILLAALAAACGSAETDDPSQDGNDDGSTVAVAAVQPGELPEGEAILNLHWFPRTGSESTARLLLDGVPAVYGPNSTIYEPAPVIGSQVTADPGKLVYPLAIPTGTTLVELEANGHIVASETIDLASNKIYSLVAYGTLAEPQHQLFVDDLPMPIIPFGGEVPIRVINLHPEGKSVFATLIRYTSAGRRQLFADLAYAQMWEGVVPYDSAISFTDDATDVASFGVAALTYAMRIYTGSIEPQSGNMMPSADGWFTRPQ